MINSKELKSMVDLAGKILPLRAILVRDPESGIVGRFFFKLELVEDNQVSLEGYAPLAEEDIKVERDGSECVKVTIQLSPHMFLSLPQTGSPWSKLLVFLGPRLSRPIVDLFPESSTRNSQTWISSAIHLALEHISALHEALTRGEVANKLPKIVQALGLKSHPTFFSTLRFEESLHDGRLTQESLILGIMSDNSLGELTDRELQGVLLQTTGIRQLDVVRPDDECGKLEYSLITGWSGGTILMLPREEMLPAWASRSMTNIGLAFVYESAAEMKFTVEEKSAFNTADFATQKFHPAYLLALKISGQTVEACLVSRQNDSVPPDSVVRLNIDERFLGAQENFVTRLVWAARWACSRAATVHTDEIVKAGVYLDEGAQWAFVNRDSLANELKAALAVERTPQVLQFA